MAEAPNPSDEDRLRGTSNLLSWYDSTRPMFIDLVGDYAGKELFLVEGDSLLRECFEDERIDFDSGYQILHTVYVVERFLENLVKRHCSFHIAFFEENAALCTPSGLSATSRSRYLLARAVIKRHLALRLPSSCPDVEVNVFPSLESEEFKEYLHLTPIHFVMMHDGSSRSRKVAADGFEDEERYSKILLRGIIWWWNTHTLNVALINRIEFRDSKVFTMIVESFTTLSKRKLLMTSTFLNKIKETKTKLEDLRQAGSTAQEIEPTDLEDFSKCPPGITSSESYFLAAYGVSEMLDNEDCDISMASAFILHLVALKHISLSDRRLALITFDSNFEAQINKFLAKLSDVFRQTLESKEWGTFVAERELEVDTIDIIDGRVFRAVIQAMRDKSIESSLSAAASKDWKLMCRIVAHLAEEEVSMKGNTEVKTFKTHATKCDYSPVTKDLAVLPFSHPVFDKHLECIHVETETPVPARLGATKLYRETTHWHNYKKPLNPKAHVAVKVSKWRNPLRTNQFYMTEMTNYAASLTGATGKALEPETITVGPKQLVKLVEEKTEKSSLAAKKNEAPKKGSAKKGTKAAVAGLSKKDQMKADNDKRRDGAETDKAFSSWTVKKKDFDILADHQTRYLRTDEYLKALDANKKSYLEGEINTHALQSLLGWWADVVKSANKPQGYHIVALIWTRVRTICNLNPAVSKEIQDIVARVCDLLEIGDAISPFKLPATDRKLSFVFIYPTQTQNLKIGMTQTEFQLNYCGPYMDRMLDAKPDPRVTNFIPDGWQRDVLDQLDANKSVFVVAPTSAGKTFISFYAMEQVLRAGNDGVLIYVAPTKALVNQIAAEVQGRFSKKFPLAGKSVWAIHTRDYRVNNPTGCQILVTVPHILQIMLLSPSNSKSWAPRVRRIIFDEIHSIGQSEDGVVWEQLLLLAPCPIIALSATVGNPQQFNDWLVETQRATGTDLKMIQHHTRYSDLRKYIYEPPKSFTFTGLGRSQGLGLGLDGLTGFEEFHPVASLVDKSRGMPDDLALEPRDCLSLWKAMVQCETDAYKVPKTLDPAKALPKCVRKVDIFEWEKTLKDVLLKWMSDSKSPFDKVVLELSPKIGTIDDAYETPSATSSVTEGGSINPYDLKQTTLPLLYQLNSRCALPTILFNYDRSQCENIGFAILEQLVEAESKWKEGPQWKKLMDGYEKWKELKEKKLKKPAKPVKKSKDDDDEGGSKMDRMREEASDGSSIYDLFDPEAPQADFNFANPKRLQKAELEGFITALRRKNINEDLIELLKRGVGIHHAGMNRKYRQCVEMLFRKGFLRVVIATGTLSLGINMPCATVVFSGDSVYLTALNFRQAAGRSGRRGFDLLGNVIFQGISKERASRLLSSKLPELIGHFPITTTLVLRLFTLLNGSKNSAYAKKAINSMLSQPRLYLGGQSFKEQVLHHLRFSIEYLRRNELLGQNGEPINLTSCVSHLYFTENSSFAFHALLRGGYFHELCTDIDTHTDVVLQKMMIVLSHLFGRQACREVDDPEEAEMIKRSPSIVYLPSMPEKAIKILKKHNEDTLGIFTTYATTFASQHVKKDEESLPFTHILVGESSTKPHVKGREKLTNGSARANGDSKSMDTRFLPSLPAPHARSAFVALSGHGDEFATIEDLCSSTKEGVFLEAAVIPHLELPDETRTPLNAYLLDFYMHGAVEPLNLANGIRKSDVWFKLNDFSLIIATILTSLALYLGLDTDSDPEMLDVMGSGDTIENDADEKVAAETEPEVTPQCDASVQPPRSGPKNKSVVENWDESEDHMTAEEDFIKKQGANGSSNNDNEEYDQLMNVYKAFKKLKAEFDAKFYAIWA